MANENKKLHGSTCALCGNKVKLLDRNYLHMLSDGPLCQKCHMTILQLLTQRRWWISEAEYMQVMQKNYSIRQHHSMPLENAQALFALRDGVCSNFLKTVDLDDGNVFAVQNVFAMPKSPPIFILRAMKLKKKAVLQGFTLKGTIQKGDRVRLNVSGTVREFTALDVIPAGTDRLEKAHSFHSWKPMYIATESRKMMTAGSLSIPKKPDSSRRVRLLPLTNNSSRLPIKFILLDEEHTQQMCIKSAWLFYT